MTDGMAWTCGRVDAAKMKVLALLLGDPNPIHFDVEAVKRLHLGDRVVNQGPSNVAMLVNMLRQSFPDHRLLRVQTKLLGMVREGDSVTARGVVTHRDDEDDDERIRCDLWLELSSGERVVEGEAELSRGAGTTPPDLPSRGSSRPSPRPPT